MQSKGVQKKLKGMVKNQSVVDMFKCRLASLVVKE